MSERRSLPPMQYAPPEDGHVNHGAIRPIRAARFITFECAAAGYPKLAQPVAENSGAAFRVRCRDCQMADIMPDMVTNKSATELSRRMSVRLSESLLRQLEATAEAQHKPVSDFVRQVLIAAAADQVMARPQLQQGAESRT